MVVQVKNSFDENPTHSKSRLGITKCAIQAIQKKFFDWIFTTFPDPNVIKQSHNKVKSSVSV